MQRGKYFRILADVYVDGKSLADGLIQSGHAGLTVEVSAWGGVIKYQGLKKHPLSVIGVLSA